MTDANRERDFEVVVVRDRDRTLQCRVDEWDAVTLVAAVSSDPRCFADLHGGVSPLSSSAAAGGLGLASVYR